MAGAVFFLDLLASLHVGFIATCGTRKLLVMCAGGGAGGRGGGGGGGA